MTSVEQEYIDIFHSSRDTINSHSCPIINEQREEAMEKFARIGFPTKKEERYKYTNIQELFSKNYGISFRRAHLNADPYVAYKCDVPNMDTSLIFMINDTFYKNDEYLNLPNGVVISSLSEASEKYPELVKKYYNQLEDKEEDAIRNFNTAFVQDGLFIFVPKNVQVEHPVQLINVLAGKIDIIVNRRILIILEEGAELKLLACDHTHSHNAFLNTQVIEAFVGSNAKLELYELEESTQNTVRLSNLYVHQENNSQVTLDNITLNNGTTRNNTNCYLSGEGANIDLNGVVISDKNQHVDNNTYVEHKVPNCQSRELYKCVLDEEATGAFAGLVLVKPDAQHTLSEQTNRNLCLTREAHMYTQPQLEIYADDVKCSHGATVGQLDEKALFYMQQRGISVKEAKLLLMFAFVNEVIDKVSIEALKERLHNLVEQRFRGELGACRSCKGCNKEN